MIKWVAEFKPHRREVRPEVGTLGALRRKVQRQQLGLQASSDGENAEGGDRAREKGRGLGSRQPGRKRKGSARKATVHVSR